MDRKKRIGVMYLAVFGFMILINYLVGSNVGEIAEQYDTFTQPAGYVFSIWGLIYILLFIWIVRLFITTYEEVYESIWYWIVGNFLLNALWIIAFTQGWLTASLIFISGLLITTVVIYNLMRRLKAHWFDVTPFSVYFGWVSVATVVNFSTWAVGTGRAEFAGVSQYHWALALLVGATLIAMAVAIHYKDWIYPLVFLWAYAGIVVANEKDLILLMVTLAFCIIGHLFAILYTGAKQNR